MTALDDAVAASVKSQREGAEGTPTGEATAPPEGTAPASQEVGSEVEHQAEDLDAFKAQWGVDLSVLPDDEAQKFVAEWRESNKTIGKLQREKAEALQKAEDARRAAETPTAPEPTVNVASLTDEQIASAIGINLESSIDPERDQREVALTRTLLEQQERLEKMEQGYQSTQTATKWDGALSALVAQHGQLPEDTTFADVLAYAQENGIASPEAAYWTAVGPIRAGVAKALEAKVSGLRTDGKKSASTIRPRGSANVDEAKLASTNVKDAVKEAFERARQAAGVAWVNND